MDETNYNEVYEPHPVSEVELLGYAKNYIVEVEEMVKKLPYEHWVGLACAYRLLDAVQEHLLNDNDT